NRCRGRSCFRDRGPWPPAGSEKAGIMRGAPREHKPWGGHKCYARRADDGAVMRKTEIGYLREQAIRLRALAEADTTGVLRDRLNALAAQCEQLVAEVEQRPYAVNPDDPPE